PTTRSRRPLGRPVRRRFRRPLASPDEETRMSKSSSGRSTRNTNTGRVTIGGITGVVVLVILLIAQYVLDIDVLDTEEEAPPPAIDAPAEPTTGLVAIPGGYDGGWFQLYFTDPINTQD